jgi:hypothetical protein
MPTKALKKEIKTSNDTIMLKTRKTSKDSKDQKKQENLLKTGNNILQLYPTAYW